MPPFPDRLAAGSSPLDGPPPSPEAARPGQPSFSQLAQPFPIAQAQPIAMPPELLAGIKQRASAILDDLDAFSQVTPEHGPILGQVRDLLSKYLDLLTLAGAPPPQPTATGAPFPGGGIARGGTAV